MCSLAPYPFAPQSTFPPLPTSWPTHRSVLLGARGPRHDPPATFACPAGLWRRWSVGSVGAGRFAPGVRAAAGLFRDSCVKLEAQVAVSAPGTYDSSCSRTGPIGVAAARRNLVGVRIPCFTTCAGLGEQVVAAFCVAAAGRRPSGCGGSGWRSVSTGVGGSLLSRRACLGGLAPSSGLLGGLEAVLVACDSLPLHPSAWIRALSLGVPVIARCLRRRRGGMCMCMVGGCGWGRGDDGGSDGGDARPYRSCRQPR